MRLIINSNILISALIKDSPTRKIIFNPNFKFYLPDFSIDELKEHLPEITQKANITEMEINQLIDKLLHNIQLVPITEYQSYIQKATEIIGLIDKDDIPFIALALSIKNDGIWSNDTHYIKTKFDYHLYYPRFNRIFMNWTCLEGTSIC